MIYNSGTDIILWHGKTGKSVGHVDTNQLKNNMAAISPNGRFIAAAAFTADVKVALNVQIYLIYYELLTYLMYANTKAQLLVCSKRWPLSLISFFLLARVECQI